MTLSSMPCIFRRALGRGGVAPTKNADVPADVVSSRVRSGPSYQDVLKNQDTASFRAALQDDGAGNLFDYWVELVRENGHAPKSMFDPVRVHRVLNRMYVEEWICDQSRSHIRLLGEEVKRYIQSDAVRPYAVDDAIRPSNAIWTASDHAVFQDRRSALLTHRMRRDLQKFSWSYSGLVLPFDGDDGRKFSIGCIWSSPQSGNLASAC